MLDSFLSLFQTNYTPQVIWAGWSAIALSYIVILVLERINPAQRGQAPRAVWTNVWITTLYLLIVPAANFFPGQLANAAVHWLGGPWLDLNFEKFTQSQSILVQYLVLVPLTLVPVLVYDFFYYWFHRLQHSYSWTWEQHKLHHTDEAVNVSTSLRHHWSEEAIRSVLIIIPMSAIVHITPVQAGVITMLVGQWGYLIHMNSRVHLGPFTEVFVGPQVHRIHHSVETKHYNKNFAAFFPIWDIMFGTYYKPVRDEFPATGVVGCPSNPSIREVLFGPFMAWWRMGSKKYKRASLPPLADEIVKIAPGAQLERAAD